MRDVYLPMRYNHCEPINSVYDPKQPTGAIEMLSIWGSILLKRKNPKYLVNIKTGGRETKRWCFHMSKEYYRGEKQCNEFIELLKQLFECFSPIYAVVSLESDHIEKHSVFEPETGQALGTRGYKWFSGEGLPGVYWLSIFGEPLVEYFGEEKLLNLEAVNSFNLTNKCIAVQAYSVPNENDREWRRSREQAIAKQLGEEYFFDNRYYSKLKLPRRRKLIPGIKFN